MAPQLKDILNASEWIRKRSESRAFLGNDIKQKDLIYNMMNATDPKTGQSFTQKDLWLESFLLLTAGKNFSNYESYGI